MHAMDYIDAAMQHSCLDTDCIVRAIQWPTEDQRITLLGRGRALGLELLKKVHAETALPFVRPMIQQG